MRRISIAIAISLAAVAGPTADQCAPPVVAGTPAPVEGAMAPDFDLPGSDGRTYRLSDYRGKQVVVLTWFAKAGTSG